MRRTHAVGAIWSIFAVVIIAIVVTYSRIPPDQLYNVTGRGLVDGGLSRALVYVNFPLGLAAMVMLLAMADRMAREARIASLVALALWLPVFSPSVVSQSHLDADWRNAVPAAGVALAALLTLTTPALRPSRVRGDRLRVAVGALFVFAALPWIAAELGFGFRGVPVLGQIFQTQELRWQPGPYVFHPAVHYGDHHGLEATLRIITALLLSRMLGAVRSRRLHATLGFVLALVIAYGIGNVANDFWTEQVVKRGWTTWLVPDVLEPKLSYAWLVIVVAALVLWFVAFRPRYGRRTTPEAASAATSPSA